MAGIETAARGKHKEIVERKKQLLKTAEYGTVYEIQEAYGYGLITDDEREQKMIHAVKCETVYFDEMFFGNKTFEWSDEE